MKQLIKKLVAAIVIAIIAVFAAVSTTCALSAIVFICLGFRPNVDQWVMISSSLYISVMTFVWLRSYTPSHTWMYRWLHPKIV